MHQPTVSGAAYLQPGSRGYNGDADAARTAPQAAALKSSPLLDKRSYLKIDMWVETLKWLMADKRLFEVLLESLNKEV
ncbi:unnamed protein product [Parascedosporium putredinis]|uniref:Uncharacterized protein n=1 Tax=Parascedosporium putredinis TaxID=1442378 RepID=A0A9P1MBV0_9PEZI|nr:unnamed protein product [Parascedosporium putredinis]CAI8000289.1 unnamed protein product [Parascedosporium putredinis]